MNSIAFLEYLLSVQCVCVHIYREILYDSTENILAFKVAMFLFCLSSFCWPTVLCCLLGQHIYIFTHVPF